MMFVSLPGHLTLGSDVATGMEVAETGVELDVALPGSLEGWLPVGLEAVKAS